MARSFARGRRLAAAAALLVWAGCAVAPGTQRPGPARGVPGFDTRDYPGDDVMRRWLAESPYRWVGYYLPAPCHTGTSWNGRRAALDAMGWGLAVLFVGEQDWRAMAGYDPDTGAVENPRCTSDHLTQDRAIAHADDATAAAVADGFPDGTIIFLDVERVDRVSAELASYVRAWTRRMLEIGRFDPALYAHDVNVEALYPVLAEEFVRAGRTGRPALWVARSSGFDIRSSPRESGYAAATVWQGVLNTQEEWAGRVLNIDINVADSRNPSAAR